MRPAAPKSPFLFLALVALNAAMAVPSPGVTLLLRPATAATPPATVPDDAALARKVDALLQPHFPADQPGVSVLVARNGRPVYRKAFGVADLERKTPLTPDNVFRIGSVTKQFTAAAILRLAEQGKLGLKDDITKHLPDYPTHGAVITIENLLTHTSGIKGYTEVAAWEPLQDTDLTHDQVVDLFQDEPLLFPPGTRWQYSNSGYYLLGMIIERASGRPYAEYLTAEILAPLGMTHTGYGRRTPSWPGEVAGYTRNGDDVAPAELMSMSGPFAAGALVSSVDDLLRWDNGLADGTILTPESRKAMFTPFVFPDGRSSGYACGWGVSAYEGHPVQEHNGGINGFHTHVLRMPDDRVYVALLLNTDAPRVDPGFLALKIVAAAVGKPLPEPGEYTMAPADLDRFVGVYAMDSTMTRTILREGDRLYSRRGTAAPLPLFPTSDSTFAFDGRPAALVFGRGPGGAFDRVTIRQSGITETAWKTDRPVVAGPAAIRLPPAALAACAGAYELAPGFVLTITHEGSSLMAQATGQGKAEIFPESETLFFFKVVDAKIEFQKGTDGVMTGLVLLQGGQRIPGRRLP